jgi:adenylate cyclase
MALRPAEGTRSLSFEIVRGMQEVVAQNGIPYFKVVGHELVAAAGFGAGDATAAAALIADAAIAVRDRCLRLFEESDRAPAFRIGIDCGSAMGSMVGTGPKIFNLWGEAVRTSEAMAASAVAATVQVTEAAYYRLRSAFMFRRRGRFYLPRIGEAQTFVLAGRS